MLIFYFDDRAVELKLTVGNLTSMEIVANVIVNKMAKLMAMKAPMFVTRSL
jgi:hypothetical protein